MSNPKFVVTLWDIAAADRGRGTVKAVITDATDIGVSSYANQGGEMFFTLPWNHPQITECVPWQRHYEVKRWNPDTSGYDVVGVGLLNDYDADENEVVVYGQDYLSLFDLSISTANTSYTSTAIGTIISAQASDAMFGLVGGSMSPMYFMTLGSINSTTTTATVLTSYQPRLQFFQQLCELHQSDSSVRPIVAVSRSAPFTFTFQENAGSDKTNVLLKWGGTVNAFRYQGGWLDFGTWGYAIGQKREGASILTSAQSYASTTTYGRIERPTLFIDIVDQAALDKKTKRFARRIGTPDRRVALQLRSGQIAPWGWGELADSLTVSISRGIVSLNGLYTVWGQEWIGKADGSEDLFLSIVPKET